MFAGLAQNAAEHLDGVRLPERNVGSPSARRALLRRPSDSVTESDGARVAGCVDPDPCVGAARAPDREDAVLLAVEVDRESSR